MEYTDKALSGLIDKLTNLIEVSEGSLPEIANQMLIYGAFDAKLSLVLGIIFIIPAILFSLAATTDDDAPGFAIFGCISIVLSLTFGSTGICTLYKINNAPKLYLLQQTADLVKNKE